MDKMTIYLDNAASSWPKPPEVYDAVKNWMQKNGANPGRGSHAMGREAHQLLYTVRSELAHLFHVEDPSRIALLQNITEALNVALFGFLEPGDHVVSNDLEHNSIRRPLERLKSQGVNVNRVQLQNGNELESLAERCNERTKLLVLTHGSNVTGEIIPLQRVVKQIKHIYPNLHVLVDAAQTVGYEEIDVTQSGVDLFAFTGHKGLFGPQGTGGLYVAPGIRLEPLLLGGTGGNSESVDAPLNMPERLESGTRNTPGFAGLLEGIRYLRGVGISTVQQHDFGLIQRVFEGLCGLKGVTVLGPPLGSYRLPLLSFTVKGYQSNEVVVILDQHYRIAVRGGLHCAPDVHQQYGTKDTGAIRVSVSWFTTVEEVDLFIAAMKDIVEAIV